MGDSDEGAISIEALQLAFDTLDEHCRELLHVQHDGVFESFQGAASRLESELVADDPIHPPHLREDIQRIVGIFRSVGKD